MLHGVIARRWNAGAHTCLAVRFMATLFSQCALHTRNNIMLRGMQVCYNFDTVSLHFRLPKLLHVIMLKHVRRVKRKHKTRKQTFSSSTNALVEFIKTN